MIFLLGWADTGVDSWISHEQPKAGKENMKHFQDDFITQHPSTGT